MSKELAAIAAFGILMLVFIWIITRIKGTGLNRSYFQTRWKELEMLLRTTEGTTLAIIEADKLVDEALKRLHMSGKTMGERMVSAQRKFSNPDAVWTAHKIRNRLVHEPGLKPRKSHAQSALKAYRQALRDLGAL